MADCVRTLDSCSVWYILLIIFRYKRQYTSAIPKSTSDWLVKKVQNREQNFIIWNSYVHNCIIYLSN